MKKLLMLSTVVLLVAGLALASTDPPGKKKSDESKNEIRKEAKASCSKNSEKKSKEYSSETKSKECSSETKSKECRKEAKSGSKVKAEAKPQ